MAGQMRHVLSRFQRRRALGWLDLPRDPDLRALEPLSSTILIVNIAMAL